MSNKNVPQNRENFLDFGQSLQYIRIWFPYKISNLCTWDRDQTTERFSCDSISILQLLFLYYYIDDNLAHMCTAPRCQAHTAHCMSYHRAAHTVFQAVGYISLESYFLKCCRDVLCRSYGITFAFACTVQASYGIFKLFLIYSLLSFCHQYSLASSPSCQSSPLSSPVFLLL